MKKLLFLIPVILLTTCNTSKNKKITDKDFAISVLFKGEGNTQFMNEKMLKNRIIVISGTGSPENPYKLELEIKNTGNSNWEGIVKIDLVTNQEHARIFLPGYIYGDNQANSNKQLKLLSGFQKLKKGSVKPPYSPFWYMRSDQLTHPVAMVYCNKKIIGISGSPYLLSINPLIISKPGDKGGIQYNGFHCSTETSATIGYTVGYYNYPGIYTSPTVFETYNSQKQGCINIGAGRSVLVPFKVFAFESVSEQAIGKVLQSVYEDYHESPLHHANQNIVTAARDISNAISKDAWNEDEKTYSLITLKPIPDKLKNRYELKNSYNSADYQFTNEGLIGWTNGMVIAVPLLQTSFRLKNEKLRKQALEVADDIMKNSINPRNGLPFCTKINRQWTNKGWWTSWMENENVKPEHSTYIIGQSLYYFLKAYEIEKLYAGVEHKEWLEFVGRILKSVLKTQNAEGAFPRFWAEENMQGSEYDAFSGCWVAAALAYYAKVSGEIDLIPCIKKSEEYYYRDVSRMECVKTPLDVADAPDSEGVLSYIRLTKILFELTRNPTYLNRMKAGLDYALSFTFCYNVPVSVPPLNKLSWSTSGGSITSVCNAVIHCMLNTIVDEIYFYYEQTGNGYYKERLLDIFYWGLQVYNKEDQQFLFGKKGWSTEYFCQAERYVLDIRFADSSRSNIWFAYHPWATASVLEGICGDMWENKLILDNE